MEYLDLFQRLLGGFTTLCTVDFNLLFVCLDNISPILTIISSSSAIASTHSPLLFKTCKPLPCAPIRSVIKLMSPWAAALSAFFGSSVIGG